MAQLSLENTHSRMLLKVSHAFEPDILVQRISSVLKHIFITDIQIMN